MDRAKISGTTDARSTRTGAGAAPVSETQCVQPCGWVQRFLPAARDLAARLQGDDLPPTALDLACGNGRHTRLARRLGYRVVAVDRDLSGLSDLAEDEGVERLEADLEDGRPLPVRGRRFAAVIVTNYLHRPLLDGLVEAVAPGGRLLYATFSVDQPAYGRPTNPDFLLAHGELLDVARGRLRVVAYEDLVDGDPPAARQRLCADRMTG